jgi:PAS domain S-box-containing protein
LRAVEERFRTLLDNTQGIIFMIDRDGVFVLSEGKGLATLGLEPGQVVGMSALEMYKDFPPILRGIEAALSGETVNSIVDLNGPVFESFYSPYRDANGEIAGMIGMATDITARERAMQEQLRVAEEAQKAQKLESLGLLAGGIAHDFNNLLVSVLGSADLMQRELAPSSSLHRSSERIVDAARQAAALCEQLLAYAGKGRFEIQAVDVSIAVREMIPLLELAVSKKVSTTWDLADDVPQIDADETQLRQIAMNLISNASEAIGTDVGTIRVRTGAREYSAEELQAYVLSDDRSPGRYVYLEVADSGCGMDGETRAKMFDPFFTTKFTGRGLGMATVLGIVQRHRGAIRIDSAPGRGCTVTVLFPARATEAALPEPPTPIPPEMATGTVLLVDDEETVRVTVSMMLEESGFDVITACDGVDALEKAARHGSSLRCVLLDMTMPRMSGAECLRALRQIAPTLPVVLSSGYSEAEISSEIGTDGNTSFIHKPYRFDELTATLAAALRATP